jgi:transcription elongation GreA/GreB family factor
MSRAFVKDSDGADGEELAELQVSPHRNLVTADGLRLIEEAVERLRTELAVARGADDRATVRRIQRDLRYWTERQRTAEPVPPAKPGGKARFGSTVVLATPGGGELEYRIVGEDEADPARGRISYVSPIARQIIGAEAGDEVDLPDGRAQIREVR